MQHLIRHNKFILAKVKYVPIFPNISFHSYDGYCNILRSGFPAYKIKPHESILRSDDIVVYNILHCENNNDVIIKQLMTKLNWLSISNKIKAFIFILQSFSNISESVELIKQSRTLRQCHTWSIKSTSQSNVNYEQLTIVHLHGIRYHHEYVLFANPVKEN